MSEKIDQLRADLKAIESVIARYDTFADPTTLVNQLRDRIAKLEADSADPWQDAKRIIEHCRGKSGMGIHVDFDKIGPYIDHLEAENARITGRVAEFEAREVPPLACFEIAKYLRGKRK